MLITDCQATTSRWCQLLRCYKGPHQYNKICLRRIPTGLKISSPAWCLDAGTKMKSPKTLQTLPMHHLGTLQNMEDCRGAPCPWSEGAAVELSPAQLSHDQAKNLSNSLHDMTLGHHRGINSGSCSGKEVINSQRGESRVSQLWQSQPS